MRKYLYEMQQQGAAMNKNAGFGVVGIVLVVAAVIVVGLMGWRVYDANSSKQGASTMQANQSSNNQGNNSSNGNQTDTATYLDVKELGIKVKLSDDIKDATYSVKSLSDGSKVARFSTAALAAQDAQCNADFGPLGSIEMTTDGTDRTGAPKVVDNVSVFKLGNYYYSYSVPQALCSESVRDTEAKFRISFADALKTMQLSQ
jgi:hypothetical protein